MIAFYVGVLALFISIALVPLLALMFAVLKGFGVQNELEPLLLKQLAVGGGTVVTKIYEVLPD